MLLNPKNPLILQNFVKLFLILFHLFKNHIIFALEERTEGDARTEGLKPQGVHPMRCEGIVMWLPIIYMGKCSKPLTQTTIIHYQTNKYDYTHFLFIGWQIPNGHLP